MNIFILDNNLEKCAEYHNDKHVIKMILEHTQMICTVLNERRIITPYRSTHINHPCVKWLRESDANINWLSGLTYFLNDEYKFRFNKEVNHKSFDVLDEVLEDAISSGKLSIVPFFHHTPFRECMPSYCKKDTIVESYRNYYKLEKGHIATWTKRGEPEWWKTV